MILRLAVDYRIESERSELNGWALGRHKKLRMTWEMIGEMHRLGVLIAHVLIRR